MRALLPLMLVLAALPLAVPTSNACHMPASFQSTASFQIDPINSPNEPHSGPADFHWHECGDGHAWVCSHNAELNECLQLW